MLFTNLQCPLSLGIGEHAIAQQSTTMDQLIATFGHVMAGTKLLQEDGQPLKRKASGRQANVTSHYQLQFHDTQHVVLQNVCYSV